jgi:FkbM family methyltransferase
MSAIAWCWRDEQFQTPDMEAMTFKSGLRTLAPRRLRAYRILGGQLRGRTIVTSLHDYPGAILGRTERPLLAWFREHVKHGETWLDVGAHYGYTAIALAELVGHDGHVYAFEPSLTTVGHLNQTRILNGFDHMTVLPFGLGEPGEIRVISVPTERGMANHALGGKGTEDILVVGFDHLWKALGGRKVHGVKIDVQGMELEVLQGMTQTLSRHRPKLVIEFHSGVSRERISELLRAAGYLLPAIPIESLAIESNAEYQDNHSYVFQTAIGSANDSN